MKLIEGYLGWGNRKTGLEAYGPGGRWDAATRDGDLLGDAMEHNGDTEGAALFIISVSRAEQIADRDLVDRIGRALRSGWIGTVADTLEGEQ